MRSASERWWALVPGCPAHRHRSSNGSLASQRSAELPGPQPWSAPVMSLADEPIHRRQPRQASCSAPRTRSRIQRAWRGTPSRWRPWRGHVPPRPGDDGRVCVWPPLAARHGEPRCGCECLSSIHRSPPSPSLTRVSTETRCSGVDGLVRSACIPQCVRHASGRPSSRFRDSSRGTFTPNVGFDSTRLLLAT